MAEPTLFEDYKDSHLTSRCNQKMLSPGRQRQHPADLIHAGQYYDEYWQRGSAMYSGCHQGYAPNFLRWMAQELETSNGSKLERELDAGCGDASFTETSSGYFQKTYAIDISAAQILENRKRFPAIEFSAHDLSESLPFQTNFLTVSGVQKFSSIYSIPCLLSNNTGASFDQQESCWSPYPTTADSRIS